MRWVRVWIILFRFLLLFYLFRFLFFVFIRVVFPTTLDYARKIGNPGPHYSTVLVFISSPFPRVCLASDPSCSGLRLRRFHLGPMACYTNRMTKSPLQNSDSIRVLLSKQNFKRTVRRDISMVVHVTGSHKKTQTILFRAFTHATLCERVSQNNTCKCKIDSSINFNSFITFNVHMCNRISKTSQLWRPHMRIP